MAKLSENQIAVLAEAGNDQLRGIFVDHPLWELEKILGNGSFGIALLLRDRGARKFGQSRTKIRKPRRVVLKRPIYPGGGARDFENELVGLQVSEQARYMLFYGVSCVNMVWISENKGVDAPCSSYCHYYECISVSQEI